MNLVGRTLYCYLAPGITSVCIKPIGERKPYITVCRAPINWIAHHSGEEAATLVMIPTEIMGHLSVLLLNRVASREDQGQPCLAATAARTIEEVACALLQPEGETITLPRKKGDVP